MKNLSFPFKHRQKAFTLLEVVIVIVLISFLGLTVVDRVWKFRIYAEEVAVISIIGNIRSALGLEVAALVVRGKVNNIALLQNTNPMKLLAQTPNNYLGEINNITEIDDTAVWYFNNNDQSLNYVVNYTQNFKSNIKTLKRTRHQIKMLYSDNNKNNRFDQGIDDINSLDLIALEPFQWVIEK